MMRLPFRFYIAFGLTALVTAAVFNPSILALLPGAEGQSQLFRTSEIQVLRLGLALLGFFVLIGAFAWHKGVGRDWRTRVESDFANYLEETRSPSPRQLKFVRRWFALMVVIALGLIMTMRLSPQYHHKGADWFDLLVMEGGFWETLTAAALAGAGAFLLLTVYRYGKSFEHPVSKWPALLLAVLFIFGAGEEMNWGQVWLAFKTPEALKAINSQNAFNLHNINSHLVNHFATLFFVAYGAVLSILFLLVREVAYVCRRMNIPVSPVSLVPFILLAVSMSDNALSFSLWGEPSWRPSESREMLFATVMLGMAISFNLEWKARVQNRLK
jgi:hypothetical protein